MRAERNHLPLLVIGLGGTGADMAAHIRASFVACYGQDDPYTAYLVIDTDQWTRGEDTLILSELPVPPQPGDLEWMAQSGRQNRRQWARCLMSHEAEKVTVEIERRLRSIISAARSKHFGESSWSQAEIVVCASVCGGTGAGLLLDIPQMVRQIMESMPEVGYRLTGYLMMPDVFEDRFGYSRTTMHELYQAMGYATLKELDFWMRMDEHHTPCSLKTLTRNVVWKQRPYDQCVLLSRLTSDGLAVENAYDELGRVVAEYLMYRFMQEREGCVSFASVDANMPVAIHHAREKQPYPLGCHYSALGVSSRVYTPPVAEESELLFGAIKGDLDIVSDERVKQDFNQLFGDVIEIALANRTHDPKWWASLSPMQFLSALKGMAQPPHEAIEEWRQQGYKRVKVMREEISAEIRRRCEFWTRKMVSDLSIGPAGLLKYLEAPEGLMEALQRKIKDCYDRESVYQNDLANVHFDCLALYSSLITSILPRIRETQRYMGMLDTLVDRATLLELNEAIVEELKAVQGSLMALRDEKLPKLIGRIERLAEEFQKTRQDCRIVRKMPGMAVSRAKLEAAFDPGSTSRLLTALLDEEDEEEQRALVMKALDSSFAEFNDQTIRTAIEERLLTQMFHEAAPWTTLVDGEYASTGFMMIPAENPYLEQIAQDRGYWSSGVLVMPSDLRDRVTCIRQWFGLPLYHYKQMEEMRASYERAQEHGSQHLVYTGNARGDYRRDWSLLPDPDPCYYLGTKPTGREAARMEKALDLVCRGMAAGLLIVDTAPKFTIAGVTVDLGKNPDVMAAESHAARCKLMAAAALLEHPALAQQLKTELEHGDSKKEETPAAEE